MSSDQFNLTRAELIHNWLAGINLSKPIRNFARDFSDGVLLAEIIAHFLPRYIALGNFTHVNSVALKRYNWETLQKVVFRHLNFKLTLDQIQKLANGQDTQLIESVLFELKFQIEEAVRQGRFRPTNRRSRSTAGSQDGSNLHLNQLDESILESKTLMSHNVESARLAKEYSPKKVLQNASTSQQPPVLDDFTKDQLIEKLYNRIRHLERNISEKDEKISQLTHKIEKLVEIICRRESKRRHKESSPNSPPSTPSYLNDNYYNGEDIKTDTNQFEPARRLKRGSSSELSEALNVLGLGGKNYAFNGI